MTSPDARASITLPDFTEWNTRNVYDFVKQISDYKDLEQLGIAINAARLALFRIGEKLNVVERNEKATKTSYDRAYRRAYLESTEKTDNLRRMRAALACEDLENEAIKAEQIKSELIRMSFTMRNELQTLQTVSNNLRQQMKME